MALEVIEMMNSKKLVLNVLALLTILTSFALAGSGDGGQGRDKISQPTITKPR